MKRNRFVVMCLCVLGMGFALTTYAGQLDRLDRSDVVLIKAPSLTPFVTEATAPLAGGEDCGSATVIGSLPYTDSGTTLGAVDDYDETCPYSGSTSGDVVYSYAPATNEFVDISVCNNGGDATYDTKIYVYENTCATPSTACNDDACQAPSYSGAYNSDLAGVSLNAGSTYYIVVDGYGGDEGDYTLYIEAGQPPPTCGTIGDPGFLIGQDVHGTADAWSAAVSGQATWQTNMLLVAESIDQAADPDWFNVQSINAWGLSLENSAGWVACDPTGMTFDVIFYEDATGVPGTVICDLQSVAATVTMAGVQYSGYDLYRFDLPAVCDLGSVGTKWVSIQSEPMAGDCSFLWMSASSGNGVSPRDTNDDGVWETDYLYDEAMCINGSTVPIELESFLVE